MLTPNAAKAKLLNDAVNNHPTEGIRHMYLVGGDELRFQCKTMNLDRTMLQQLKDKSTLSPRDLMTAASYTAFSRAAEM